MAFKRLIGTICVRNCQVVKSYGYNFWRPAGSIATALRNLDRWGADEIILLDVSRFNQPDPVVIREIERAHFQTPLVYGGGIRNLDHVKRLLDVGCDRFLVESLIYDSPFVLEKIAAYAGVQAIIGCLPITHSKSHWLIKTGHRAVSEVLTLESALNRYQELPISELLVVDADAEGYRGSFGIPAEAEPWHSLGKGIIWFGGIAEESARRLLTLNHTVAIAVGNINYEREIALHHLRRNLSADISSLRAVHL
jgi:cyclase